MKWPVSLAFDLIFLALVAVITGPPLAAMGWLASHSPLPAWQTAGLAPLLLPLFLGGLIGMTSLVRLAVPRLVPGTYPFPGHPQSLAWLVNFALMRILNWPMWSRIIFSFATLRWAMLSALGAKVAFAMQTSNDALLTDPALAEIGQGSMLAAGSLLAGHFIENDQIMLALVRVGRGAQIMGDVSLSPGVSVGENSVIGPGSKLLPHVLIGDDVYVGLGCLIYSGTRVGSNAVIGHQVTLEADVQVGEGAVVAPATRVPKGTVIEDGASYPPRVVRGAV